MRITLNHYMKLFHSATALKLASIAVLGGSIAAFALPAPALADGVAVSGGEATGQGGDGTMSAVARRAMTRGALPASDADVAAKAAANAAVSAAMASQSAGPEARGSQSGPNVPVVASGFSGQVDAGVSPPDTFGATGPTRYVQTVNRRVGIYSRTSAVPISGSTLNALTGFGTANVFDPQIIWDATTNRFYYAADAVVSSSDNRIAFGFSKSASPNSTADFCKYFLNYGAKFPDYPKLGDNSFFMLIGVNNFQPSFVGSDIIAIPKPVGTAAIATCPTFAALTGGRQRVFANIKNTGGTQLVFTPTPANSIDNNTFGYVIARNLTLPSTQLWISPVSGTLGGIPAISPTRTVTVPSYTFPPDATQPAFPGPVAAPRLDTLDARPWQAILSLNPLRSSLPSLWTQHTVANGATASMLRYYEIRPSVNPPIVLRTGVVASSSTTFLFNGAISSNRRVGIATTGGSFVIGYNVSSSTIPARIVAGSSVNGGALSFVAIKFGAGPYRDFTCPSAANTCRWGDYASATPDPLPTGGAASAVGLTHQYSKGGTMPTNVGNWTTWIYHVRP